MATIEKHVPGSFCWVELATTDSAGAKKFYSDLFGWSSHDDPVGPDMVYTMFQRDGKNVGAMFEMPPEMQKMGIPSNWLTYVTVESVDKSAQQAKSLGGEVMREPMDVMGIGRMAVIRDPQGATIAFWQPIQAHGFQLCRENNTHCWSEGWVSDVEASQSFYSGLFGWTYKTDSSPTPYTEILNRGTPIGGMMKITPDMGDAPPSWLNYFAVEDCDATVTLATAKGGQAIVPAMDIEGVGRFAVLQDPQGAIFAAIRLTVPM